MEKDDHLIRVQQAKSPATLVERDNVRLQGKQDRGMPLVIAVMDDVVTGAELLEYQHPHGAEKRVKGQCPLRG